MPFGIFFAFSLTESRSVKPGGWVEFQDWDPNPFSDDDSLKGTCLEKYYREVYGAFEMAGYEVCPGPKLEEWFKRAGFVDIQVKKFLVPYGVWPKERYFVSFLSPAITSRY